MEATQYIDKTSKIYRIAIHEAAHLVARFVLFGNIDTIDYVSLVPRGTSLGRNQELTGVKLREFDYAANYDNDFFDGASFARKETRYALAGVIAEKEEFGLDAIQFEAGGGDFESIDDYLGLHYSDDEISSFIEEEIAPTELLVKDNIEMIEKVAEALLLSHHHNMRHKSLVALLTKLYNRPETNHVPEFHLIHFNIEMGQK